MKQDPRAFLAWNKMSKLLNNKESNYEFDKKTNEIVIPKSATSPEERFSVFHLSYNNLSRLVNYYVEGDQREANDKKKPRHKHHHGHHREHHHEHHRGHHYRHHHESHHATDHSKDTREHNSTRAKTSHKHRTEAYHTVDFSEEKSTKEHQERVAEYAFSFISLASADIHNAWKGLKDRHLSDIRTFVLANGDVRTSFSMIHNNTAADKEIDFNKHGNAIKKIVDSRNPYYIVTLLNTCRDISLKSLNKIYDDKNFYLKIFHTIFTHGTRKDISTFLNCYKGGPLTNRISWNEYEETIANILENGTCKETTSLLTIFQLPPGYPRRKAAMLKVLNGGDIEQATILASTCISGSIDDADCKASISDLLKKSSVHDAIMLIELGRISLSWANDTTIMNKILHQGSSQDITTLLRSNDLIKLSWASHQDAIKKVFKKGIVEEVIVLCSACSGISLNIQEYPEVVQKILNSHATGIQHLLRACNNIILKKEQNENAIDAILNDTITTFVAAITSNDFNAKLLFDEILRGSKKTNIEQWRIEMATVKSIHSKAALQHFFQSIQLGGFRPVPKSYAEFVLLSEQNNATNTKLKEKKFRKRKNNHGLKPLSSTLPCEDSSKSLPTMECDEAPPVQQQHATNTPSVQQYTPSVQQQYNEYAYGTATSYYPAPSFGEQFYQNPNDYYQSPSLIGQFCENTPNASTSYQQTPELYDQYYPNPANISNNYGQEFSLNKEPSKRESFKGESFKGESFKGESFKGESFKGESYPTPTDTSAEYTAVDITPETIKKVSFSLKPAPCLQTSSPITALESDYEQKPLQSKREARTAKRYNPYNEARQDILSAAQKRCSRLVEKTAPAPSTEEATHSSKKTSQTSSKICKLGI